MGDFDCCANGEHADEPTRQELWSDPNDWSLPSREWRG